MKSLLFLMIFLPGILLNAEEKGFIQLTGWGGGKPEEIVPKAADTGFNEIIVWSNDSKYLKKLAALGKKYDIGIYSSLSLSHVNRFKKTFPDEIPPLQMMNDAENECFKRLEADKTPGKSNYQHGGEPFQKKEVLLSPLLCFHHPKVVEFYKKEIKDILESVPGLKGIAFDFFGYRNYHCCYCEHSQKLFEEWKKVHPGLSEEKALNRFSLETLVNFNNELADYARKIKPEVKVASHVYPVLLFDPLYGNRLDVDYCGQTAAWFFKPFWSYDKITEYSKVIFGKEKEYFKRQKGVALIGIYAKPERYPVKSPERVRKELEAILAGGGDRVQVCSMNDVLKDEGIRKVFRDLFYKEKSKK